MDQGSFRKESPKHELVDKVIEAMRLAKEMAADIMIDGELQLDAAIVPKVAHMKARGSSIEDIVNVVAITAVQAQGGKL